MHIEIDTMEILLIIVWWFASKWLSRIFMLVSVGKIVSKIKSKVGEEIESKFGAGKNKVDGSKKEQTNKEN